MFMGARRMVALLVFTHKLRFSPKVEFRRPLRRASRTLREERALDVPASGGKGSKGRS